MDTPVDRRRIGPERRQSQRMIVESLTYINLEPGSGGMILNVSEGGLGFCVAVPFRQAGMFHVRVSEPDLRIEADAEVVWSDETHRRGGLRFTKLPPEIRRQIHNWMIRPAPLRVERSYAPVARHRSPTAGAATLVAPYRAFTFFTNRLRSRLQGFSGGFATGLLLSALVGSSLLLHSRHRELGDVLVRWGERLRAEPSPVRSVDAYTRSQQVQVEPFAASPEPDLRTQPGAQTARAVLKVPNAVKRADTDTASRLAMRSPKKPPVIMFSLRQGDRKDSLLTTETQSTAVLPELFLAAPNVLEELPAPMAPKKAGSTSNAIHLETSGEAGSAPLPERYLEIGKFKDKTPAEQVKAHVAQLGLPTILAQRRRLWMNSYYVLVGPYGQDREIESARTQLVSQGLPARSYEKGSRNITFPSRLTLNGASLSCGSCTVSWEAYESNASVKFQTERGRFLQAEGQLVRRAIWYDRNEFLCRTSPDGSRNLLEIRLASTNQALVFGRIY